MRPLRSTRATSADLLGELDDDPRRAAHVAKPVDALVVHKLAYQLAAMRAQLCEGFLDVVDGEEDVADAWALAGTGGSLRSYAGERYLASSSLLPSPSGVRSITTSACTPSSPLMRSTASPSTDVSPSTSSPSAVKNSVAAARSSTTMPMCSKCMIFLSLATRLAFIANELRRGFQHRFDRWPRVVAGRRRACRPPGQRGALLQEQVRPRVHGGARQRGEGHHRLGAPHPQGGARPRDRLAPPPWDPLPGGEP